MYGAGKVACMTTLTSQQLATLAYYAEPTRENLDALGARRDITTATLKKRGLLADVDAWPYKGITTEGRRELRAARLAGAAPKARKRTKGTDPAKQGPSPKNVGRIDDDLWRAFQDEAHRRGYHGSKVVAALLGAWTRGEITVDIEV